MIVHAWHRIKLGITTSGLRAITELIVQTFLPEHEMVENDQKDICKVV